MIIKRFVVSLSRGRIQFHHEIYSTSTQLSDLLSFFSLFSPTGTQRTTPRVLSPAQMPWFRNYWLCGGLRRRQRRGTVSMECPFPLTSRPPMLCFKPWWPVRELKNRIQICTRCPVTPCRPPMPWHRPCKPGRQCNFEKGTITIVQQLFPKSQQSAPSHWQCKPGRRRRTGMACRLLDPLHWCKPCRPGRQHRNLHRTQLWQGPAHSYRPCWPGSRPRMSMMMVTELQSNRFL